MRECIDANLWMVLQQQAGPPQVSAVTQTHQRVDGEARIAFRRGTAQRTVLADLYQRAPCRVLFPTTEADEPIQSVLLTTSGVIDVSAGDKIPRKGGPGITRSDLLVINKIDLAPLVEASLEVMDRDARKMRGTRPFIFTNLKKSQGVREIAHFIMEAGGLPERDLPESF